MRRKRRRNDQAPKPKVSYCPKGTKNKTKTIFTAGLDKLGFIEAPFRTGTKTLG
jgi:hypothetical protein